MSDWKITAQERTYVKNYIPRTGVLVAAKWFETNSWYVRLPLFFCSCLCLLHQYNFRYVKEFSKIFLKENNATIILFPNPVFMFRHLCTSNALCLKQRATFYVIRICHSKCRFFFSFFSLWWPTIYMLLTPTDPANSSKKLVQFVLNITHPPVSQLNDELDSCRKDFE